MTGSCATCWRQPRHWFLQDTPESSYRLLNAREDAALRVAVFAAPFSLPAAAAVAGFDPAGSAQIRRQTQIPESAPTTGDPIPLRRVHAAIGASEA